MVRLKAFALILLFSPLLALASDNAELRLIKEADQADRQHVPGQNWREVIGRDRSRRDRVLEIIRAGQLSTAWDYYNAALVLQHGQSAEDIRLAHALSTLAATLDPAHKSAKWLIAASWDRLMVRLKQPQWYVTQSTRGPEGEFVLYPVQPGAVTDADRAALGVPALSEAEAKIKSRNGSR